MISHIFPLVFSANLVNLREKDYLLLISIVTIVRDPNESIQRTSKTDAMWKRLLKQSKLVL